MRTLTVTTGDGTGSGDTLQALGLPDGHAKLKIADVARAKNVCDLLDDDYIDRLGPYIFDGYEQDLQSRTEWDTKMAEAQKLAMQVVESKSFPWPGASNVKFPLITIAALQYHARAYPALVQPDDIVQYKVWGEDPDGRKNTMGEKISEHMTYQLVEEDTEWEENMDRALLVQPIMGAVFKKTYFSFDKKRNVSSTVLPKDLVISYFAKNLEDAERISHVYEMSANKVHSRKVRGYFRDIELAAPLQNLAPITQQEAVARRAQGATPPLRDPMAPYTLIEQQCWIDLDGDGYAEPYVATIDRDSKQILRLAARFAEPDVEYSDDKKTKIVGIRGENFYIKYEFLPSPDGGIYGLGFGILLSPLVRSIDSLINQMIDAGTLSNTAGGFLGRGVKIRGGQMSFKPFGWNQVDSTGDDLNRNIVPLPVRQPSEVLFKLLGFLVEYAERICSATDTNVGITPGQNTPAQTSRSAEEAGLKILSAIFKRSWRAMREEFRRLYWLNRVYLDQMPPNPFKATRDWYGMDPTGIRPSADPVLMSDGARMVQAKAAFEIAQVPGIGANRREAALRVLKAAKVPNIEAILPDPKGPNAIQEPPNPKMIEVQVKQAKVQGELQIKLIQAREKAAKLLASLPVDQAKIGLMEAQAAKARAEAEGVPTGHAVALIDAEIAARKNHMDAMHDARQQVLDVLTLLKGDGNGSDGGADQPGGVPALAGSPGDAPGGAVPGATAGTAQGGMGAPAVG